MLFYLEGINLSGIPATAFMPVVGFYAGRSSYSFGLILVIAIFAGILGNLTFYLAAYKLGEKLYDKVYNKFSKARKALSRAMGLSMKYGDKVCFIGRLIPGIRAFVSLTAGIFKVKPRIFALYSSMGIFVWDFTLLFAGYFIAINR